MIEYKKGNLLTEDVEALVNTVNCVGVMGRGVALQFKMRFPENYIHYAEVCKREQLQPGHMLLVETGMLTNPKYIINFPTKRHWRGKSRMEDIESGLRDLVRVIHEYNITSIALPPLGCGLGGLEWSEVRKRIESAMKELPNMRIIVFEPQEESDAYYPVINREVPTMTAGRAALIELVYRYLNGLLDPFLTLLEVHKLLYFMQETGENLRLQFKEGLYGPYAENLRHVLNAIEGHFISGYADGGDKPDKKISLVPGARKDAELFLQNHNETRSRFDRVSDLVEGFESPFGLELLSTVHWVNTRNTIRSMMDVIQYTYNWNERKKQFTHRQIELAVTMLSRKGWIKTNSWVN